MILYLPWYSNPDRDNEIEYCLEHNLHSGLFSQICLMIDKPLNASVLLSHRLLTFVPFGRKLLVSDALAAIHKANHDEIVVMAHADIFFDDSLLMLNHIPPDVWDEMFVAISRINMEPDGSWMPQPNGKWAQDVWAWHPPMKVIQNCDFPFGLFGVDQRLAYEAHSAGYHVINPCQNIRCFHWSHGVHRDKERREESRVHGKYMLINPQSLLGPPLDAEMTEM